LPRVSDTRQHIIDYLSTNGPIDDGSGRATSILKEAVGYESGDAGFSQLVSSMEKARQIQRDIRGKRTYRISVVEGAVATAASTSTTQASIEAIDYDELATALLARAASVITTPQAPAESTGWARRRIEQLEGRIDELQRELLRTKAEAKANAEERDEVRGQLEAASHNLSLLTEQGQSSQKGRAAQRLGSDERALLYELRGQRRSSGRTG